MKKNNEDWVTVKFTKDVKTGTVHAGFIDSNGKIDKIAATADTFRNCLNKIQNLCEHMGLNKFSIVSDFPTGLFPESEASYDKE